MLEEGVVMIDALPLITLDLNMEFQKKDFKLLIAVVKDLSSSGIDVLFHWYETFENFPFVYFI